LLGSAPVALVLEKVVDKLANIVNDIRFPPKSVISGTKALD